MQRGRETGVDLLGVTLGHPLITGDQGGIDYRGPENSFSDSHLALFPFHEELVTMLQSISQV